jgi:hypothetical protein
VCDRKASIKRRPWSSRGCCAIGKKVLFRSVTDTLSIEFWNRHIRINLNIHFLLCYPKSWNGLTILICLPTAKVNFTLEEAMKAQTESRGIALLFL